MQKISLYRALDKDCVPFLKFIPNLNNDIVNGVRLASKSCKFLIDIEDSSQILNIQNQYIEIDKSLFKEKVNIFLKIIMKKILYFYLSVIKQSY
ncbi:hypothetical protein VB002_06280 [Campylobacter concisus]